MSELLWFDGFERLADLAARGYDVTGPAYLTLGANNARYAGSSTVRRSTSGQTCYFQRNLGADYPRLVVGLAVRIDTSTANGEKLLIVRADNTDQCCLYVSGSVIKLNVAGNVLDSATSGAVLDQNQWHYLEWDISIDADAGQSTLRVDGNAVFTVTNINTRPAASSLRANTVVFMHTSGCTFTAELDDLYILSATEDDAFLGEVHARYLAPTGAGANTEWTANSGDNWDAVNDTTPDPAEYIFSAADAVDTYTFEDCDVGFAGSFPVEVVAVGVRFTATEEQATGTPIAAVLYDGAVHEAPAAVLGGTAWQSFQAVYPVQPNTSSWTVAAVNAIQAGVRTGAVRPAVRQIAATSMLVFESASLSVAVNAELSQTTVSKYVISDAELFHATSWLVVVATAELEA